MKYNEYTNMSLPNTHHSSSRSVSMRDIVVGIRSAPLYPAYQPCGVTNGARGFTLIELLVVVLIIGILAAVAVPQYQAVVDKTHYTQAMTLVDAAAKADTAYYLANGTYARSFYDLDVELPTPIRTSEDGGWFHYSWGYCSFAYLDASSIFCQIYVGGGRAYYYRNVKTGQRTCMVTTDTPRAHKVCQTMTGKKQGSGNDTYTSYSF